MTLAACVRSVFGVDLVTDEALTGGCVGDVRKLGLADGRTVVAKLGAGAALEARMLRDLAARSTLPVPGVLFADDTLLLMGFVPTSGRLDAGAQADAADHLARLHAITSDRFGFDYDTVIGGLHQPNPWTPSWRDFFRDQRLLFMGRAALESGRLPATTFKRLEALCARLDRWIDGRSRPSLIHGDMWTGNVLCRDHRISAFVDPAIYFADAEIELAFSTLFGTFEEAFFRRYAEHRPIAPGFFEERRDLYNLYPLLVHVRLFGGSYVAQVEQILRRFI